MTTYKLTRDTNGNKCLSVRVPGYRAFSIQTNGNLPSTDRNGVCSATASEVSEYVRRYGTSKQKAALGMAPACLVVNGRIHRIGEPAELRKYAASYHDKGAVLCVRVGRVTRDRIGENSP